GRSIQATPGYAFFCRISWAILIEFCEVHPDCDRHRADPTGHRSLSKASLIPVSTSRATIAYDNCDTWPVFSIRENSLQWDRHRPQPSLCALGDMLPRAPLRGH